jgi:probable F420-dependent oxidoreductase
MPDAPVPGGLQPSSRRGDPGHDLRIGAVFPQTELGAAVSAVREYGQRVEEFGFTHVLAYDHVVGADPTIHSNWSGPYDIDDTFHEPLLMFSYLAAITSRLEFATGVLVLPQRQAVLVAKQAAELDLLSGGRFRLGVAVGWNAVEYEALGESFGDRGDRLDEQVDVIRRLWTEKTVTLEGRYHRLTGAGIAPPPVQRPIPIWFGGGSRSALARAGRVADGWFPPMSPGPELDHARAVIEESSTAAGRDPALIGMEGHVHWKGDLSRAMDDIGQWRAAGATHVAVNTMDAELRSLDEHLEVLQSVADSVHKERG